MGPLIVRQIVGEAAEGCTTRTASEEREVEPGAGSYRLV